MTLELVPFIIAHENNLVRKVWSDVSRKNSKKSPIFIENSSERVDNKYVISMTENCNDHFIEFHFVRRAIGTIKPNLVHGWLHCS